MRITILSPSQWSTHQVSNHLIAAEFAEDNMVYYYETPGVIGTFRRLSIIINVFSRKKKNKYIKAEEPQNLRIYKLTRIPFIGIPIVDMLLVVFTSNIKLLHLRKVLVNSDMVIICSPLWFSPIKILSYFGLKIASERLRLHIVDDWTTYSHLKQYLEYFSDEIDHVEAVITPNKMLLKESKKQTACIIPHCFTVALEENMYHEHRKFSEKIDIVFAGTMANWVDYDLLRYIAEQKCEWNILLIGKLSSTLNNEFIEIIKSVENIHLLGAMGRKDLHETLLTSRVGIIPYKADNRHIRYCSPTKIMDYLGCGLPVVSTDIPYCEEHPYVETGKTDEEILGLLEKGVETGVEKRRNYIEYALSNKWEKAASAIKNQQFK